MGVMFNLFPLFMPESLQFLPFSWISVIWFFVGIVLMRWRAKDLWMFIDFPEANTVPSFYVDKGIIKTQKLYPSIVEGLLRTGDETRRYLDPKKAGLFCNGHSARINVDGVNHCIDMRDCALTNKLSRDNILSLEEMDQRIKAEMLQLKDSDQEGKPSYKYVLTGSLDPLPYHQLDVVSNPFHKEIYEALAKRYYQMVNGEAVDFLSYKTYQVRQKTSNQMAAAFHYMKSEAGARALRLKKGAKGGSGKWLIIAVIIALVLFGVALFVLSGGLPSGL
jgi:hypothetical protein